MKKALQRCYLSCLTTGLLVGLNCSFSFSQNLKPGLTGMTPSKWIRFENTHAPERVYSSNGAPGKEYSQEDFYFKMWLPVVHRPKFTFMVAPNYRLEQFEIEDDGGDDPLNKLAHWSLRSLGVDARSLVQVDSAAWLMLNLNVNQSGNLRDRKMGGVPLNFTFSTLYLKKKSATKEIGYGLIVNQSFGKIVAFPAFAFNYNFSSRTGLEMLLPRRVVFRYNASPADIFFVRSEAMSRSYYIRDIGFDYAFRRTEVDLGLGYNRQFGKLIGIELFGGYRKNINTRLSNEITCVKTSGLVFSVELFLKSPIQ